MCELAFPPGRQPVVNKSQRVIQTTIAYLGAVEEEQIPYLKAAYAKRKPRLVYEDGTVYPNQGQSAAVK